MINRVWRKEQIIRAIARVGIEGGFYQGKGKISIMLNGGRIRTNKMG